MSEPALPDQLEVASGLLSGTGEGRKRREDSPELVMVRRGWRGQAEQR